MQRVLVTGATGLIGRQALHHLADRGYEVHAVSTRPRPDGDGIRWHACDLADPEASTELVRSLGATDLLHFAWSVTPGAVWTAVGNVDWVGVTLRLLRAFADGGGSRVVLAGSCGEYAPSPEPCREFETPIAPHTLYGVCKDATRRVAEAAAEPLGISLAWGRIFFVYGPHEHHERLVASVSAALLRGEPARTSHGRQIRDYMHSSDVASAFVALLESQVTGPVNVGSGRGDSIARIVTLLGEMAGRPELVELGARPAAQHEPPRLVADVTRLRDEVGWAPRYSLEEGLAQTLDWWRSQIATGQTA